MVLVKASRGIALDLLVDDLRSRVRRSNGPVIELIQGLLLAFAFMVILMAPYMRLLREAGVGKQIRREGPETHYVKEGTPTMGGILLIAVVVAIYLFLRPLDAATFAPLATLVLVGRALAHSTIT